MCEGGASSKVVPAAGEDLLGPRSGKQKQCPGVRPLQDLPPSSFPLRDFRGDFISRLREEVGASKAIPFSLRARNQTPPPPSRNKWKWGEGAREGSTTGQGAGEAV